MSLTCNSTNIFSDLIFVIMLTAGSGQSNSLHFSYIHSFYSTTLIFFLCRSLLTHLSHIFSHSIVHFTPNWLHWKKKHPAKDLYNIHLFSPSLCHLMHLSDYLATPVVDLFLEVTQASGSSLGYGFLRHFSCACLWLSACVYRYSLQFIF